MNADGITFSVIVPTCDRPMALERCLDALGMQDFPGSDFEVIVVNDGGCTPPTIIGASLRRRSTLILLDQPTRGPAAARNLAVQVAHGQFLAFTDDDCVAATDWLSKFLKVLRMKSELIVGGHTLNGLPENIYALANEVLIDFLYQYYHMTPGEKSQAPFFTTNNLALSRKAFQAIGGFDERLRTAEDRDLSLRLLEAGYPFHYESEALVYHFQDLSFIRFISLHFRYGRGNYRFHRYRKVRGWGNYRLEPLHFYTRMLGYPFSRSPTWQAVCLSSLLAISQVGNFSGFVAEALHE